MPNEPEGMRGMSMDALLALEAELDELEQTDPKVMEARKKLDAGIEYLRDKRWSSLKEDATTTIPTCPECGERKFAPHHEDCSHYGEGPAREAGGYQYLNEDFVPLHTTSVPKTDQEALDYFEQVDRWFATSRLKYIWRRPLHETKYKLMPYEWDRERKEVRIIGSEPQDD